MLFSGSGVALITPFDKNGINFKALDQIIEHIIDGGTSALFVLGTTGEPSTMTKEEKLSVIDFAVKKVNKRIPVFAGSGGNNTEEVVNISKEFEALKADGLLIVTPYYNKCTQNGVVAHYKCVSDAVNIPIVAYNVPGRTGFNIAPATAVKLADIKNVAAIKESSGNIEQIMDIIRLTKDKMDFYSGDDILTVASMVLGGKGVISVAANIIPKMISKMAKLCLDNNYNEAVQLQLKLAPFIKALFSEVNPIPIKKAMQLAGFDVRVPRLPLTEMESETTAKLKAEMIALGIIKGEN